MGALVQSFSMGWQGRCQASARVRREWSPSCDDFVDWEILSMAKVVANGFELYYESLGMGPPIVFLSGLGGDHRAFAVTQRQFSARFHTLALDNRDVGRSDRASKPYNTADMADDCAAWLRLVGVRNAAVVGHSLGGLVAQELTLRHRELVGRLILASTHVRANPWRRAVIESWILLKERCDASEFARATMPWLVAPKFFRNDTQVEGLIRFADRNAWPQAPDAFARQARAAAHHDATERLAALRVPTLVLVGENDIINPPETARELTDAIPAAMLKVFPGVGHLPHIEDGAAFRAAVEEFLAG